MMDRDQPWTMTILLGAAGICLVGLGIALGLVYCEYRRVRDLELTHQALMVGSRCMETLGAVVPGALILARQSAPRVVISPAARDSARIQRWMTP